MAQVIDANLIDPVTARDYVQQREHPGHEPDNGQAGGPRRNTTRFCGVPISAGRLGSQSFRPRFVLLRTRYGGVLLLSPKYGQRMVNAIGKPKGINR